MGQCKLNETIPIWLVVGAIIIFGNILINAMVNAICLCRCVYLMFKH